MAVTFLDTSVLLAGILDFGPQSAPAQSIMHAVAEKIVQTPATAWHCCLEFYSVATRLPSEFRLTPPPETLIGWCSGPSCRIKGGQGIREALETELGIGMGENTQDNKLGLHFAQCNGTCEHAAQVWVNGEVVGPLTPLGAVRLVRDLRSSKGIEQRA